MSLEEEVLDRIRPSPELVGRLSKVVDDLMTATRKEIDRVGIDIEPMIVGSVAKDSFVGEPDIDLFMKFPYDTERTVMERTGLEIGRRILGGETRYAEHPYTHGRFQGFEADMVPCFDVKDPTALRSAVDRTPFHTEYVKRNLKDRDQVRLLKQFAKGIGVYGAEARVQGFSGYLLEIMIIRYSTFENVLLQARDWRPVSVLAIGRKDGKGGEQPLTFIDPVDPKRNVASALSLDCLSLFCFACKEYLRDRHERFFFPNPRPNMSIPSILASFQERETVPLVVTLTRPDLIDDNLFPQTIRTIQGLRKLLLSYDFDVISHVYDIDGSVRMLFELRTGRLPSAKLHEGPPVWSGNSVDFLKKWQGSGLSEPFISDGKWNVIINREVRNADEIILKKGREASLGQEFRDLEGLDCQMGENAIRIENATLFTKMLDKRMSWVV